jgi:hypothetical protein
MSITKAHLTDSIHNQLGLPQNQSVKALESIIEIIKNTGKWRGCHDHRIWKILCERKKETERKKPSDR